MTAQFRYGPGAIVCIALLAAPPAWANGRRRNAAPTDDGCPCSAATGQARRRTQPSSLRRAVVEEPAPSSERSGKADKEDGADGDKDDDDDDAPLPLPRRLRRKKPAPSSVPLHVLGGLGIAGLLGYGVLVTWARDDNRRLGDCTPNCSQATVDHVRRLYLAADAALGVSLGALAAATWIYVATRPTRAEPVYSLNVQLLPGGAVAGMGGRF